jgi:Transglycosylase-like domain
LPDVAGRRRAASVALLVATIVASLVPLTASSATAPAGLNRFLYALGEIESGGNYYARNPYSGAYGKYQIMPSNWPAWAKIYTGSSTARQTPTNQERVARGKVIALHNWLDTWPNVAHWWLTGSGERNQTLWSSTSRTYVARLMKIYGAVSDTQAATSVGQQPAAPPLGVAVVAKRHYQETSAAIRYAGHWASARHTGYAGDHVRYSSTSGAKATLTFSGSRVSWVGPVGSTRGKARIRIDGVAVKVIDLYRTSFKPRVNLFTHTWAKGGKHTITIEVVGSGRPVAIDEFVVTR